MGSSSVPTPGPEPRRPHPRSPRPLFLTPQGKTERQQVRTRPIHGEQVTLKVGRATDAIIHVSFCRSWSPNVSVTTSNHFRFCFVQNHLGCIHLHPKGPDFDEVTRTAVLCLGLSCSTRTYIWGLMRRDRTEIPSNIFHWSCYLYHPGVSFRIFFLWGDTYPINHVAISFYLYLNIPSVVWWDNLKFNGTFVSESAKIDHGEIPEPGEGKGRVAEGSHTLLSQHIRAIFCVLLIDTPE